MTYINPLNNFTNIASVSSGKAMNNEVKIEDPTLFAKEIDKASNKNGTKIAGNDDTSTAEIEQVLQKEIMKICLRQMLTNHIENNAQGPSNGIYDVLATKIADEIV